MILSVALLSTVAASPPSTAWRALIAFLVIVVIGVPLLFAWARFVKPMHLALGFAATALLWVLGYVALLQPGLVAGEALFVLMLGVLFASGFVAGRYGDADVRPVSVGLVSAIANLLVVGAFLRDEKHGSTWMPIAWLLGLVASSALLAWLGGALGRRLRSSHGLPSATALFAMVAATTVFLLIVLGGVLTGEEAGLAVPDWPNSYGHNMLLYPVSEMKGGIFYEGTAHRLYGMLVGATSAVLVVVVWRGVTTRWVRALSVVLLLMVCTQGLLGGLRVTGRPTIDIDRAVLSPSTALAIVHGVFAQLVFAAALVIAAATSRRWQSDVQPIVAPWSETDRKVALALPAAIVVQLVLGALYRHLQPSSGAPAAGDPTWAFHLHLTMAIVVLIVVIFVAGRAWSHGSPVLARLGKSIAIVTCVQIALGVVAVATIWSRHGTEIPPFEVVATTLHQGAGALLLGLSTLLAAWSRRLLAGDELRQNQDSPH